MTVMKLITTILLILAVGANYLYSAEKVITGKVTSDNGEPLIGVTVAVRGTSLGTSTKTGGIYTIAVPENAKSLVFRFVGMITQEVRIGDQDVIDVKMQESSVYTDEVVVTAVGMERERKSLGYSIEELSSSQITDAKSTNIINALTGKVAGVNVTSSSGIPGSASFITIRGISSLTGENQPLFVVDGIPIDNSQNYSGNPDDGNNNLLYGVGYSNRAIDLAPEDIESMTVLKGPSATALYGLRASSGAIIITTKKGKIGTTESINVAANISYGLEEVNQLPELQQKWAQGYYGEYYDPSTRFPYSWGPKLDTLYWDGQYNQFDKNGNIVGVSDPNKKTPVTPYDNLGDFYRMGQTLNTGFSMTGGSEFGSFYLSVSQNKTIEGVIPNSNFERTTFRFNGDARVASFLKAGANVTYINSGGRRIQQGSNLSGVMLSLLRTPVTFDNSNGYGADGAYNEEAYMFLPQRTQRTFRGETGDGAARYDNPFWTVNMNPFQDNVDRFIGSFQLDFTITNNISFMSRFGGDHYNDSREQVFAVHSNEYVYGQIDLHTISNTDLNWDNILAFDYHLTQNLKMKFNLGQNMYESSYMSTYVQGDELIIPEFNHISNTSTQIVRNEEGKIRRFALYGDVTFNYLDWLYVNGTLRNEWSTSLPEDNNSFLFGAINLSFVFTEAFEEVFANGPISFGQFRANYAVVGKDAPIYSTQTPYIQAAYTDGWTNGISFPFNSQVGFVEGDVLGNTGLTPEITKSWEVGLNMNFLNNRIGFDLTYYSSMGYDQIFSVPIAVPTGYWRQIKNAGKISNKGIEFLFNLTPIVDQNFRWDITLNFAKNINNVEELAPGIDNLMIGGFAGSSVRAVAGQPYGTIFGAGYLRDSVTNELLINDDPESAEYGYPILTSTEKSFGTYLPDWTMGITNTFNIFGFKLSFLFDWRQGGMMWNGTRGALYSFGMHIDTENRGDDYTFSGIKASDGTVNDIVVNPDVDWYTGSGGGFSGNTEDFVESTTWIRLRELTLAYTLPRNLFGQIYFPEITLSFTGRNLWLSTDYKGIDPETSLMGSYNAQGIDYFNMPSTRSYIFGINFNF